jgi:type IV secretion system protein VirB9
VLGANAEKAIELSDAMKLQSAMPTQGKNGRVTYTFGSGLPTVVCSPLHISIVELEPGEVLTSEPTIGDSVRWEIMPGSSGSGKEAQPLIIIKPHVPDLDTNLVVTTNKRTYYLRLVSHETDYVARTAFSYKDDEDAQWKQYLEQQQQARVAQEDAQIVTPMAGDAIDKLNFDYDVKGGNAVIRPIRIMDDGQKTYITMPDAVLHQDLPALVVVNTRLKGEKAQEIVNYRVKGDMYVVDRLFDRAALVIGSGKAVDKVEIRRRVALAGGK